MLASLVVSIVAGLLVLLIAYFFIVALLNSGAKSRLEASYRDECFAKRCLAKFSVCSEVIEGITKKVKSPIDN